MRTRPAALLVAVAIAISGCGSSPGTTPDRVEGDSIADHVRAPSTSEITNEDVARVKRASASRAFIEFWSDLQWQNWFEAADRYNPGLQRVVGARNIIEALKYQASLYRTVKPAVQRETTRRGLTTVRFSYQAQSGPATLTTTIWRREDGRWTLVFDPLLDTALQSWSQNRAQRLTAPDALKPTKEALKAGIEASELQGRYLQSIRARSASRDGAAKPR